MRRSRIQVKPLLSARPTRPTSDNNVASQEASSRKENESLPKSVEGAIVSSVPATAGTNSSTSSVPKLNVRRPAFSVRPRPSIRGLGVPNLHGTEPTPILVAPSFQQKEAFSSGDGAESVVKKLEDPISVAVPLDIKEKPVAEVNREDSTKNISEKKDDSVSIPRRSKFPVQPNINVKGRIGLSSRLTAVDIQPDSVKISHVECTNREDQSEVKEDDQPDAKKKTEFEENTETSVKTTSNVEAAILPRLSRFPIQPRSDAKDVSQSSTALIFSITKTDINPSTSPSVTPQDAPSAIIKDTTTSKTDDSKRNSNNKDLTAISKGMTIKSERTSLPKRSRFVAQFKLNAEMTSQSSASPPTPAIPSPTPAIPSPTPAIPSPTPAIPSTTPAIPSTTPAIPSPTPAIPSSFTSSSKTSVENPSAVISNEINISEMNKKTNSKMKEDNQETFAVVSKESDTIKTKTTILSESDHFEIPSKTKADAEDRSSTSSTKPNVSKFTESESTSISTEATSTLASDDNKLKDNSQINVTNKNDDASTATTTTTDKESTTQPAKDIPVLSRRMRFPIRPKLAPQSKDELQSTSIVEKTSEETLKTSNEMISVVKTSVLSRRSRFQIQPKPSGKTSKQSSSAPVNNMKMSSSSPSLSDNELTPKSSQGDTPSPETEESKPKEESGNHFANKEDMEDTAKELPSKSEMTSLPTLSRRSRFQIQPKVRNSQSKDKQPDVPANEDKAKISNESTNKRKTTILSESDHFEIPSKTKADATSISTEATSTLASDDNKLKDDSQINVTNKNDDDDDASTATTTITDRESTIQPAKTSVLPRRNRFQIQLKPSAKTSKQSPSSQSSSSPPLSDNGLTPNSSQDDTPTPEVNKGDTEDTAKELLSKSEPTSLPSLSRRSRFQVQPKVRNSQSKDKQPDVPVNEEKDKILNDGTSKSEAAILPRRNRFQVQPKPGAKSTEPSSSVAASTKVGTNQSVTKEDIPLASVEMVTSDSGNKQTVNSQKNDDANSTDAALKIEAAILPRRNRFQVQPKHGAKSTELSSSVAASTKVGTNQSVTKKDVPLTSVETVTSDSGNKQTVDFQNNDGDTTSTDAAPKIEKPPAPTVSRRSRFQVRPKLGISKDLPKTPPSNPKEAKEKRVEKTPSKSATSIVSLNTSAKNDQQNKEDGLAALPQKNTTQDEWISSEGPKSSEKSSADSSVQTPVKLSSKNSSSLSSPLKDNIQIENIKQREYPVNVHKASSKSSKSLPLREKQKKPDVSVHPSDKPPDKGKMRMRDLIYWNPSSNPMKSPHAKRARPVRQSEESPTKPVEPTSDENEPIAVPQVKIGADGNIVLNEESLVINNSQPTAPVTMEVVDETDAYSNYGSFRRYTPKSKWSLKETKKFFLALSSVGTDFSLMTNLFTKKSRRDLKNKFKREERNNRWLVDKAIQQQLHFDEKLFEEMSESEEEDVEPPTKKSRQKKDPSESLKKKERKSGKSKKDSTTANKSKQKVIETEEGEVEPPAKKSRTKKDSSKNLKTKEKKSKAPKTDAASKAKKTKKSKHMTHKDWVIASQDEEMPGMSEEIVEEEPVMNEMLIIPESTPYAEDTLTRTKPKVPGSQSQEEEEVVNILIEMGQNGGLDSRAQQRSQVPSSVRQNKHLATLMPTVKTHSTPTPTAVPSNKPGVSNRGKSIRKVPQDVSTPGSSSSSHVAAGAVATTSEDAQDNGSLARLFLQQMGLNSQLNALQDEIVSITEAEISNNDQIQKVILVEVQPKDQKQTVVHMYLVSRTDGSQPCTDGSAGGQVTVSAAQPLALPPSMSSLSDTPSTPNRTDRPSTPNRTDAPSMPNRTDAPSTPNRTDAPSTPNRTDAPSTPNRTDAPSTPNRTDAPSTPNRTDAPSTPNRTDAPSTPNRTDAPSTPNRTDAPSTPNRTDAPSTPNRTDAPSTPNRTDAPSTPNRTDAPSTPNRTDAPSTPNRTDAPSTPNRTDAPSTPNRTDAPSTPNRTDAPSTPNRTDAPSTPNRTDAPSTPNRTDAPSTPNRTDAPSTPNRTDAPSTPNRTDAPSTPNRTDAPSTPNRTDAPSTPNRTDAPSTPNRTDAPSTPNRTDAPSTPNRTDAPSTPNRTDAPSTPNRTDAPSTPNRTDAPFIDPSMTNVTEAPTPDTAASMSS